VRRREAIEAVTGCFKEGYVIACNGFISRELFSIEDRPQNFYVLGSMGLPPAIGLGVALARQDKIVVVITGDGNQLMSLGTLATIGKMSPKNYVEVVLDNECYETTGGQETSSSSTNFHELARSSGFKHSEYVDSLDRLVTALGRSLHSEGPILVHAKIYKEKASPPRARIDPCKTKDRFMKALTGS
jgi:thiamine pyrophosphate-dependent acetolactate synthase large subunit-like protein